MNNDNLFDLVFAVVFDMNPQLELLGLKAQDLLVSFCIGEGRNIPQLHLRYLHIRSEIFLLQDETGKINNITGK